VERAPDVHSGWGGERPAARRAHGTQARTQSDCPSPSRSTPLGTVVHRSPVAQSLSWQQGLRHTPAAHSPEAQLGEGASPGVQLPPSGVGPGLPGTQTVVAMGSPPAAPKICAHSVPEGQSPLVRQRSAR
jgi:hypothetical protein